MHGQKTLPLDGQASLDALWERFPEESRREVSRLYARLMEERERLIDYQCSPAARCAIGVKTAVKPVALRQKRRRHDSGGAIAGTR